MHHTRKIHPQKIIAILIVVVGIVLLLTSNYISARVVTGKAQIASGQSQVDSTNSLFGRSRATKPFGQAFTGSAQSRINAGQVDVDRYERLAGQLKIAGVVLIIAGIVIFVLPRRKK